MGVLSPSEVDEQLEEVFQAYCGGKLDMDGRAFQKLCRDCALVDRKFTSTDADLLFKKVVQKGQRRLSLKEFEQALYYMANKKGLIAQTLRGTIAASGGPVFKGTITDAVRFHDDQSTYTGVAMAMVADGPSRRASDPGGGVARKSTPVAASSGRSSRGFRD